MQKCVLRRLFLVCIVLRRPSGGPPGLQGFLSLFLRSRIFLTLGTSQTWFEVYVHSLYCYRI